MIYTRALGTVFHRTEMNQHLPVPKEVEESPETTSAVSVVLLCIVHKNDMLSKPDEWLQTFLAKKKVSRTLLMLNLHPDVPCKSCLTSLVSVKTAGPSLER